MIISHKYQFIFIKTRKTAGTSIEVYLSSYCGDQDILTPIHPPVASHEARNHRGLFNPLPEVRLYQQQRVRKIKRVFKDLIKRNKYYNHIPARRLRARIPEDVWKTYFKFCVERNPWDKTLSHYHMRNHRFGGALSLHQYFQEGVFCVNYPTYTDYRGRLMVDQVVRYEALAEDLGAVFDRLGVPFDGTLGIHAKSMYRTDKRPYRDVFSDEQNAVIRKVYAKEISLHGYTF